MATTFANPAEKQVVTSWAKRCAIKTLKVALVVSLIMSLGAWVEYKYRIVAGISHFSVKKGR